MKVLHAIAKMDTGGAESLAVEMITQGPAVGLDSALLSAGGVREDELLGSGIITERYPIALVGRSPIRLVRAVLDARTALLESSPDVIIAHNIGISLIMGVARESTRNATPMVSIFHGVGAEHYGASANILRSFSDHVVTVSRAIADRLIDAGMRNTPFTVIRNAISMPALPDRTRARASLGLEGEVPVLLCLARLAPQKRHDNLLRAFAQMDVEARLLVVGDGPLDEELRTLALDLGVDDRVIFLGRRRDIPVLFAAADCTVLASDWEGLPIVVLESMAAGVPVVATDVDGLREVAGEGAGLLVPPDDPQALAAAMARMIRDSSLRQSTVGNASRRIREEFSPSSMMQAYAELLSELQATGPVPLVSRILRWKRK